ncbi:phosphotransferase [Paenibacillus chartarius]|uniref:Phosphotransferase n=1 Tax=Paenibacillus chartarius TaxID=747481 RepID=A0ABV6DL19_9BACL
MSENHPEQLAALWLPDGTPARVLELAGGGKNNTTRIIEAGPERTRYVLRVYETHRDEAKLAFEHAVLLALAELRREEAGPAVSGGAGRAGCGGSEDGAGSGGMGLAESMSGSRTGGVSGPAGMRLQTPVPQRLPDGATFARVPAGEGSADKLAALFSYTEGVNPALVSEAQLESFGRAVGLLSERLQRVRVPLQPAYRPYYELEHTHPLCPPHSVAAFCAEPPAAFRPLGAELLAIRDRLRQAGEALPGLRRLPHALVHGDLNASNVLADADGEIVAVLDFEFVTRDLRVMELAVCLSDVLDADEPGGADERSAGARVPARPRVEALLRGYGARLTAAEVEALPLLVLLRRLDVFIHFLGRYWDGVDTEAMVREQIASAASHIGWLDRHTGQLMELCRRYVLVP